VASESEKREAIATIARDLRKNNPKLSQEAAQERVRAAVLRQEQNEKSR
jgi:uncharacterized membrane protein